MVEREKGCYTDPFERHEARSMSDGTPTGVQEEQAANESVHLRAGDSEGADSERGDSDDGDSEGGGQSLNERMAEAGQSAPSRGSHTPALDPTTGR